MAAAIITVVEISRIRGTRDSTCKSIQVHPCTLSTWSKQVHDQMSISSQTYGACEFNSFERTLICLAWLTHKLFQNPNLSCNNCSFDTIHQTVVPRFKCLQLEVLPVLTQEFISNQYLEASIAFRNFQARIHNAKRRPYLRVACCNIANKRKFHHHRAA